MSMDSAQEERLNSFGSELVNYYRSAIKPSRTTSHVPSTVSNSDTNDALHPDEGDYQ